ncbi:SMI1/KNR4 family protein [Deinococcus sp.]|uniref:SMI1/KNR4 family protein n=1 Tax=Deinococcus sp. TaxID=47478 RepID=UPI003CC50BA0
MKSTLQQLEQWLKTNYRAAYGSLQPGLSDAAIDALLKDWPFKLSADVRALYRWRNGFEDTQVQLLPNLSFLPLEYALELAGALWAASAEGARKSGTDFFPRSVLPIFADEHHDLMLLVQGSQEAVPSTPAQVAALQQGQRLYAFERLEDLLKSALELLSSGVYAVDQDHDAVSVTDEARAQATWRKYPLLYLEKAALTTSEADEDDSDDLDDDESGENLLAGLMSMLGLNPEDLDPATATLEELDDLQEVSPVHEWPEALQQRFHKLGGVMTVKENEDDEGDVTA